MGSQLASLFTISEEGVSTGGPCNIWKIYKAKKKSNNVSMSLFVIDKKRFHKEHKHVREELYTVIRKEVKAGNKKLINVTYTPEIYKIIKVLQENHPAFKRKRYTLTFSTNIF